MTLEPFNLDAERGVVGAIINAGAVSVEAGHRTHDRVFAVGLRQQDFYLPSNGELFASIVRARAAGVPLDAVSLADHLEQEGAEPGVRGRLERLAHEAVGFTQAEHWARIVARDARRRRAEAGCAA